MRVIVILLICLVIVGIIRLAVEKIMPNRDKKFYHAIVRVVWGIMEYGKYGGVSPCCLQISKEGYFYG